MEIVFCKRECTDVIRLCCATSLTFRKRKKKKAAYFCLHNQATVHSLTRHTASGSDYWGPSTLSWLAEPLLAIAHIDMFFLFVCFLGKLENPRGNPHGHMANMSTSIHLCSIQCNLTYIGIFTMDIQLTSSFTKTIILDINLKKLRNDMRKKH